MTTDDELAAARLEAEQLAALVALIAEVTRCYFGRNAERGRQMIRHELDNRPGRA